jgi:hypothetical protein
MQDLPRPEVKRCFFEDGFQPPLPAMVLRWSPYSPESADRTWHLPDGVSIHGPAPTRFGIAIHRVAADGYRVRVLWNGLCLQWERLRSVQIMASSLAPVMAALGSDPWSILTQCSRVPTTNPAVA